MSSFDFTSPPSKRRKITTTYGSQNTISRALRAVKNVFPAQFALSSTDQKQQSPVGPEELDEVADTIASKAFNSINGTDGLENLCDPANGSCNMDDDEHRDQHYGQGTSKRVNGTSESPIRTRSSKKRRKNNSSLETGGPDERQTSGEIGESLNVGSPSCQQITQHSQNSPDADEEDDASDREARAHTIGERSSGRSRRMPKRFSSEIKSRPSVRSTPQKTRIPKDPSSTPSRKRGRPRKHPITTPKPHEQEENEFGFHEITLRDPPPLHGRKRSRDEDEERVQNRHSSSKKVSSSYPDKLLAPIENEDDLADGRADSDLSMELQDESFGDQPQAQIVDFDGQVRPPKVPKVPGVLRHSIGKLQRLLQTSSTESIDLFKSQILRGLVSQRPLVDMEEEYCKVQQLVSQTVLAGEGNSMLVVGPRGCGKTALVETVLADLDHEHHNEFIVVRLNGFIHTDDKLALREIWRQLGREEAVEEDKSSVRTNYADTLTSLLALLTHSSEVEGKEDEIARSVVFVIDEFDLFANHPRQTLLYNLFDVAQSRNAPIAVLGLTTRTDIVESLEKRVKSRFGQRYVYLTHPRTFSSFADICKSAWTARGPAGKAIFDGVESESSQGKKLQAVWNDYVDALFSHDQQLDNFLRRLYALDKCVPSFLSSSLLPVGMLSKSNIPTGTSFLGQSLFPFDSRLHLLSSLSDLELSLLIAAARLDVILDTDVCNFALAYEEYVQLASRVKVQSSAAGQTAVGGGAKVWGKEVALGSWEKLMELGLVLPAAAGMGSDSSSSMCRVDVALEEIGPSCPRMGATMSKWCKEI
ncbi:MAG: hypothetical protein Q9170_007571 [Blastenia crenularia]